MGKGGEQSWRVWGMAWSYFVPPEWC